MILIMGVGHLRPHLLEEALETTLDAQLGQNAASAVLI
jgi:hypothetical protein